MLQDYHPRIHELKTWPEHYQELRIGNKNFELRKDDRDFHKHDLLILREWHPVEQNYTGYVTIATITSIVRGEWLAPGYVALGIAVMEVRK